MDTKEIWKPIPGYDGYEASSLGNIRSYRQPYSKYLATIPHVKKQSIDKAGYCQIVLMGRYRRVHQLVMLAFIGICPDGMEICHGDGVKTNNKLNNLRYDTHYANVQDMIKHNNGIHPKKKITLNLSEYVKNLPTQASFEAVQEIRGLYASGNFTLKQLGAEFGYSISGISRLVNNNRRKA